MKIRQQWRILILSSVIFDKASYELEVKTYEELLKKKGISRSEYSRILEKYMDNTDTAVIKSKEYIDKYYCDKFKIRLELNKALKQVIIDLPTNKSMRRLELNIADFIIGNYESLPDADS
ncbi:hypothetical protein [Paenibacillus antarcticus]|uniref:Uncharacterized protein n=1 Tax=Paenibacillus antarcticus TaxID=253703 RepID=A0A168JVE8_9BACL|nr:hypothetical protein [Paenibacillus antarcticus]OAB41161.1 hypothetical protein PBAT_21620 [Paenibacillus antarcticus]